MFALLFMGVCGGRGCGEYCLLHVKKNYVCHPSVRFVYNGRMIRAPHVNSGDPKLIQSRAKFGASSVDKYESLV